MNFIRGIAFLVLALALAGSLALRPARAQFQPTACADDYITIETVRGTILEIKPTPEPFKTADIFFSGPSPCDRMWMQVLKTDALRCHVGNAIEVTGVVTMDVENKSWEIGPTKNDFMTLGEDFRCTG